MQNPDLQQIYQVYWDLKWASFALALCLGALFPFLQGIRRNGKGWRWPPEPLRSVCQMFLTIGLIYPLAGVVGKFAESPRPGAIYLSLTGLALTTFVIQLLLSRHHTKATALAIRLANDDASLAKRLFLQLQEATDIDSVFERPSDSIFIEALTRDLHLATSVRVVAIGHGSVDHWSGLWEALSDFVARGGKLRIMSDTPTGRLLASVDHDRVPEVVAGVMRGVFAIDCGGPFYFGIGSSSDDLLVARFDGRSRGKRSLASGVFLLTNQLSHLLETGLNHAVNIRAAMSPADYKDMILALEGAAKHIDRIPKRLFVVFKSGEMVRTIAEQRYGIGSVHVKHYVEEHKDRSALFFAALGRGMSCREIYNKAEIIAYVRGRKHGRNVTLTSTQIEETVVRWRDAVLSQPNYMVGLTDMPLPFKYELVDGLHFVMHEAIGQNDEGRMNAFCVTGREFCKKPMSDFEIIWNNIPPAGRKPKNVVRWIEKVLRGQ